MIKNGQESGLRHLYQNYSTTLFGIIFRILERKNESEEVLQAVFLKIWNHIDTYDEGKATLFTWMAQIARNAALDVKRLKSFENQKFTDSLSDVHFHTKDDEKDPTPDLERITKQIPEKYRVLIDKMYLYGYTQQEISDEMDIPLGTVKTRLREAVVKLREVLKSEKNLLYFLLSLI